MIIRYKRLLADLIKPLHSWHFQYECIFSDKTVRVWEWNVGIGYKEKAYSPLRGHKYGVTCVRVSPQGCMVASASIDGTAVLWNIHSGGKIFNMTQVNGDAVRVCR